MTTMLERVIDYFLDEPRRLIVCGLSFVRAGGFLVVLGAIGYAATTSVSIARGLASQTRSEVAVADVFPTAVAWVIPNGPLGFALASGLVIGGIAMTRWGRAFEQALRY